MKYTFVINQVAAVELGDVDAVDCMIIEWLRDICVSQSPSIVENRYKGGTWVSHQYAVNQMPLLGFKDKSAFRKRLQKLLEKGYFSAQTHDQKCYVKPLPKMDKLFTQPSPPGPGTESPRPRFEKRRTEVNRVPQAPNSIHSINKIQDKPNFEQKKQLDHRGTPSPTAERMRKAREKGLKPWEVLRMQKAQDESESPVKENVPVDELKASTDDAEGVRRENRAKVTRTVKQKQLLEVG